MTTLDIELPGADLEMWALAERGRLLLELGLAQGKSRSVQLLEEYANISEVLASMDGTHNDNRQRNNGIYYTSFALAKVLVNESINARGSSDGTLLEPCVGGGAFLFAWIDATVSCPNPSADDLRQILARCFIADNDKLALKSLLQVIPHYLKARYGEAVNFPLENVFEGDSLLEASGGSFRVRDFRSFFKQPDGFDFVITNPPYLSLKKDRRQGPRASSVIDEIYSQVKSSVSFRFLEGTVNLHKLFTEAILDYWVSDSGVAGLLVPRSLLTDVRTSKLRRHLLEGFCIGPILQLREGNDYFKSVGQALSAFAAVKGKPTASISFGEIDDLKSRIVPSSVVPISTYERISTGMALFDLGKEEMTFIEHLARFTVIREHSEIVNLRGELDMSLDREFISDQDTGLRLVQGANVKKFGLGEPRKFVRPDFLARPKGRWVGVHRLACQQISNWNQTTRMKWTHVPPGYVLANSCNFLALRDDLIVAPAIDDIFYLLGLLNSDLMNRRFRLLSPNNHVSNTEIGSFPVGNVGHANRWEISRLAMELTESYTEASSQSLNRTVEENFGIPTLSPIPPVV